MLMSGVEKLSGPRFLGCASFVANHFLAVLLGAITVLAGGVAHADSLSLITSAGAQGTNDSVRWSQLGGNTQSLGATINATSNNGVAVTLNLTGSNSILAVVCPASSCSWSGTAMASGDTLIWTSNGSGGGNGPANVTFSRPQSGAGAYIQADGPSAFTAQIQAFNGSNLLGSFVESSDSVGDGIYIGVQDYSGANITSLVISLISGQGVLSDFAFDSLNLNSASPGGPAPTVAATPTRTATPTVTATPIPGPIGLVGSSSTTSTNMRLPAGVQSGDLLLAFYSYWSLSTATPPGGWQLLTSAASGGSGVETVWYRFATSSDTPGSSYTWSFAGSPFAAGGMLDYRGVDPSALPDGFCTNAGNSATPTLCSFATRYSNDIYVGFFATENTNLVLPSDLTGLAINQYANGLIFGVAAASKSLGGAGNVPTDVASMNSGGWATIALALKALNPGSTPNPTPLPTATAIPTSIPGSGSITLVGSSSTTSTTTTIPAGVQTGDLLLAFYSYWSSSSATAPNGWQLLQSATSSGSGVETVWYRIATGGDTNGASYTWTFGGQPFETGGMLAYRGVSSSAPEDGFCTNSGHSANPVWCSFSTSSSADKYIGLIATENAGLALPGDLSQRVLNQYASGSYFGVAAGDKTLGAAGNLASDTGSMSSGGWATIALALRPANGAPPAPTPMPTAAPAPITFVNATTTTTNTMQVPAGVQNGDLLMAFYSYWHSAGATAPAGWTLLSTEPSSSSGVETLWYRYANNDAPGSTYTWTFSGPASYASGGMLDYRGVASVSAADGNCLDSGSNANPTLCSMTTGASSDIYVGFYCTENSSLALPGDLKPRVAQQYASGSYFGSAAGDKSLGSPGVVPADTGSMNSGGWETIVLALKHQ